MVHIGEVIRKEVGKQGIFVRALARDIYIHPITLIKIFAKTDICPEMLRRITWALKHNFF